MLKKEILRLILIIFSIIILLALFILVFSWVCYNLPIDFPGTVGDWISGLSALTGGALTLGGVWWTIRDNENKRREDLAIQYKPLFELQNITLEKDSTEPTLKLAFDIQNIGRGEAQDFKIECNKDLFNSEDEEQNNCFKKDIILAGNTVWSEFYIQITDSDPSKNIIINGHDMRDILSYNIIITITYSNMFGDLYKQLVHIPASYNKTKDKCRINYPDISYKLIKK